MLNIPAKEFSKNNLSDVIRKMIDSFVQNHKLSKSAHEEIMAMAHLDSDVAFYFHKREMEMTEKICEILVNNGFENQNLM